MKLEDRFRKLKRDTDESIKRWEQARTDEIREAQRTIKALSPGVTKVCRSFCDAMQWEIHIDKSADQKYLDFFNRGRCRFQVSIYKDGVDIVGSCYSDFADYNWRDQTTIRSEDFTDDKLAQVLEKWYREHMLR